MPLNAHAAMRLCTQHAAAPPPWVARCMQHRTRALAAPHPSPPPPATLLPTHVCTHACAGDVESTTTINVDADGGLKPKGERLEEAWELTELRLQLVAAEKKCKLEHDDTCKAVSVSLVQCMNGMHVA